MAAPRRPRLPCRAAQRDTGTAVGCGDDRRSYSIPIPDRVNPDRSSLVRRSALAGPPRAPGLARRALPLFAEAKAWHGLRRFRLRGLPKVNGEALLVAAGQNLKRLLSRWGWGRRPWPSGAAGLVLPAHAQVPAALH